MHTNDQRSFGILAATLALTLAVAPAMAVAFEEKGGRRRGSMRNLNGNPPSQIPVFRLTVFDPELFAATCVDPIDAAGGVAGPVCRQLIGGLDHAAAGIGLRNAGSGTVALRGAPTGAVPIAARLFWSVIGDDTMAAEEDGEFMDISFEGHRVQGERVAAMDELCWGSGGYSVHYSADVGRLVPDAINGDYRIGGVPSSVTDGHDPYDDFENPPLPWAQGASLIVVYSHPDAVGRVYLHEGAALLIDALDLDLDLSMLPPPAAGATVIRHTRAGGDGQTHDGEPLAPFATFLSNGPDDPAELQIRGPGSPLDPSPDWQGQDGAPVPGLWDTQSDEPWGPVLDGGAESYTLRWVSMIEAIEPPPEPPPGTAPLPPEPEEQLYDCVYVGAVAMTTTY